jgi:hypothetical protein
MVQPMSRSISVSASAKDQLNRRASCRPTLDLPLPGMPTRAMTTIVQI